MIHTLVEGSGGAIRRIVVAGEMLELGENEKGIHTETGEQIADSGIDVLIGVRGLAREMVDGAKKAGLSSAEFVEDSDKAGERIVSMVQTGDVILVKGSRGVKTEEVVHRLLSKFELEGKAD